jgi:alkyldihydroxyacetonephosphate synthase
MNTYAVWGWGSEEPQQSDLAAMAPIVSEHLGIPLAQPRPPRPLQPLRPNRLTPPTALAPISSDDDIDRAAHSLGRSYRDLIRGINGRVDDTVDCVLRPRGDADIEAALEWCSSENIALIPYSGGTSVVGGVEPRGLDDFNGVVSLDLSQLAGIAELDPVSRAARVRAGTSGPQLEEELKAHGLTARFYPQSFERSTVGGWVATRAAGHFATRLTHIDDIVESVRAITPTGTWQSRRLPGSGAGPSPDRMLLGSEGSLGVITEAWLRVQPRPDQRWAATLGADTFTRGAAAVRRLLHDGLLPPTCRLIDARESTVTGTLATGEAALVLGFESYGAPIAEQSDRALALCQDEGLRVVEAGVRGGAGEAWRSSFVRAPHLREQLVLLGVLVETFETAITWDAFDGFIASVTAATQEALRQQAGAGTVTCRLTHVYPDGAAPYFTVMAPARTGGEIEQWDAIKAAASDAIIAAGGTITHHHAVGRDHHPWYVEQRPEPFARALVAAKRELDPAGILNPGVIAQ